MLYMNAWEIAESLDRYASHPVLSKATRILSTLEEETNQHSDGWGYWKAPVQSAAKLMTLIKSGDATEAQLKAALTPIKSFYTRRGTAAGMKIPHDMEAR